MTTACIKDHRHAHKHMIHKTAILEYLEATVVNLEDSNMFFSKCTTISIMRELKHIMVMYCRTSHGESSHRVKALDGAL